jgi:hypothetical protein
LCFFFLLPNFINAQVLKNLLEEASQLEKAGFYERALLKYDEILKFSPNNEIANCKSSELNASIGDITEDYILRKKYFQKAYSIAQKCVLMYPNNADANYVLGMSMGKLTSFISVKEKLNFSKEIKKYAEKAISINKNHILSLFLLGKWHLEICTLSFAEKTAINVFFGGVPNASLAYAIMYFEKIKLLDPAFIANYVELAKSYQAYNKPLLASEILKSALKVPIQTANDSIYKNQALKLFEQYNHFK